MFLSRFGVTNYKCLGDIDIPLTPIHVLIGPNDAGKSSLMEAIAALHLGLTGSVSDIFPQLFHGRDLISFVAKKPEIELRGHWLPVFHENAETGQDGAVAYGFSVRFDEPKQSLIKELSWLNPSWTVLKGYEEPEERYPLDINQLAPSVARVMPSVQAMSNLTVQRNKWIDTLTASLKRVVKLSLDPRAMKFPAALDAARKFRLNENGFGLPALLDEINSYDSAIFERIKGEFRRYFPQFTGIQLPTESLTVQVHTTAGQIPIQQSGKRIDLLSNGHKIPAQQASDGAILFLGILALAHVPEPPPLLLLEEPENGIYPKRLGEVITLLRQLVERTDGTPFPQIILSTHSPYVLSFFQPEEVTFLSRPPGKPDAPVRARPLRDAPHIRERMGKEFYLGELWYNLSEEELFDGK